MDCVLAIRIVSRSCTTQETGQSGGPDSGGQHGLDPSRQRHARLQTEYRAAIAGLIKASGVSPEHALEGKRALVLGAGSIARAVVYGLRQSNVDVVIASRNLDTRRNWLGSRIAGR